MSNNLLNDFFNPQTKTETSDATIEFRPSPKKGTNGTFEAIVRFLPHPFDPNNKSIMSKYTCWLTHPRTGERRELDCPSTIGQRSILVDTFFNLRNNPNPVLKENAAQFSRKQRFTALIQIIKCASQPQLDGKILVWRFGFKVYEKLQAEMNPPIGDPHNPFNIITGRPFLVRVKEVSGFTNYDSCMFFDLDLNQSGFQIQVPNAQGQMTTQVVTAQTVATPEGQAAVLEYLQKNAPDTTQYEYHPLTDADIQYINECIQIYTDPAMSVQAAAQRTYGQNTASQLAGAPTTAPANMGAGFPQMPMGQHASAAPTTPQGLQLPNTPPSVQPAGMAPQFTPNLPEGLNEVIGGAPTAPAQTNTPAMGLNLTDVLAGQMV